ncbi:vitamin K-dependent protein C [Folsomia candida]|uniref:vitamin K-dependent protein C n=1 Tax=Folsomia candida TaxID=158441 RepID=UPI000B9081CA|nr:vitamin K-dependent protein C [Folsomia candida]
MYVLTSASCMDGLYATSVQVWLTAHDSFEQHQASFGNVKLNVQEVIKHPNFDRRSKDNDLCLLRLSSAVDISGTYFVPVCLPSSNYDFAGTTAKISGWSDGRAYKMCKAEMPILDNKICNRDSRHSGKITDNMVCAGFLTPTRLETCIGDAGGPLVSPNGGRATLVGLVSWGYEAKNKDYSPTVYTRVSEFSDWILHNTRDADWCGV